MNDIEVSSIDLVEGGNVFKQGHYLTLGYIPRDEKGALVDLTGKTLDVKLWGRKGIVFEAVAIYSEGVLRFTLNETVPAGEYHVEFTVTSSTDATYRKKFPTNSNSGRIVIKQSADDLGVTGIQVYTVAQLKAEQKADQVSYEQTVDGKITEVEATVTAGIGAFTEDTEVINARQGAATLGENLNGITAQLAEKAAKTEVDAKVAQIVSGTPKGTYATLAALQTAFPIGSTGVYVVTTDGKWYFWNSTAWTAGGVYQSTAIGAGTVLDTSLATSAILLIEKKGKESFLKQELAERKQTGATNLVKGTRDGSKVWENRGSATHSYINNTEIDAPISGEDVQKILRLSYIGPGTGYLKDIPAEYPISPGNIVLAGAWFRKSDLLNLPSNIKFQSQFSYITSGTTTVTLTTGAFNPTLNNMTVVGYKETVTVGSDSLTLECIAQYGDWVYLQAKSTAPSNKTSVNIYWMLYGATTGQSGKLDFFNLTSTTNQTELLPYKVYPENLDEQLIDESDLNSALVTKINSAPGTENTSKWNGKNAVALGDSITEINKYQPLVMTELGLNQYLNYGRAGTPMAGELSSDTNQYGKTVNYTTVDMVTIFAGTNDFKKDKVVGSIGVIGDTTFDINTFYGAYRSLIEYILTQKPTIRIYLWTPLQRDNSGYDVNFVNPAGHKLIDYVEAIKKIGALYSIPVLDLYAVSTITKLNLSAFTSDGLHPNDAGHARVAGIASSFLENS